MITTYASNTTTLTGSGTEDFLSSPNVQGEFSFFADLNAMQVNDVIEFRVYGMAISGGTSRLIALKTYYGVQPPHKKLVNVLADAIGVASIVNELTTANALRYSATQTFGTGRAIPWRVAAADSDVNVIQWRGATPLALTSGGDVHTEVNSFQGWNGSAVTGTLSTTQATTSLTGNGDDLFNNRWLIVWETGDIGVVTAYVSASGLITWSPAKAVAPVNGETFILWPAASGLAIGDRTGSLSGSIGSLGATAKSDVNAEVLDVINVDTYGEPGQEAPGVTVSLARKINYLYKFMRNRFTQTVTGTASLYADNGTTVDQKATVSDDATTFDRGEWGSGP